MPVAAVLLANFCWAVGLSCRARLANEEEFSDEKFTTDAGEGVASKRQSNVGCSTTFAFAFA